MDVSAQPLVTVLKGVEFGMYQLAEHLSAVEVTEEWRAYTAEDGSHPTSYADYFRQMVEFGYQIGSGVTAAKLRELIAQYRWMNHLGYDVRTTGLIGYEYLKRLRRIGDPALVQTVLEGFQTTGRMSLPEAVPDGTPHFVLRTSKGSQPGLLRLRALIINQDGVPYQNEYPERLVHYMLKRLRAAHEEID